MLKTLLKTFTLCCVSVESSRKPLKNDLHVNNTCNLICKEEEMKIMFVEMNGYANLKKICLWDEGNLITLCTFKEIIPQPSLGQIHISKSCRSLHSTLPVSLHHAACIKVDVNPNWMTFSFLRHWVSKNCGVPLDLMRQLCGYRVT